MKRSLTLLRAFLVASAAILVLGGIALTSVLTMQMRKQALADARTSLSQYVDGVLRPHVVVGDEITVPYGIAGTVARAMKQQPDVVTIKVWRRNGVLAWTNRAQERIGRRFDVTGKLGQAIHKGTATAGFDVPDNEENAAERKLGFDKLLEVYVPIRSIYGKRAIGAYEIYADPRRVESTIAAGTHVVWIAVALVFLALYLALAVLARRASRTLRSQTEALGERTEELSEAYRLLEQNAVETVETLNAAVDARDPYTAGHSQRVQEIALAVADELGIDGEELEAIRVAGLFHDIGKLGVPDAILTKPTKLSESEYALIKRHPTDGAEIVGRIARLRGAVSLIRHHHERWDGRGYPDGLRGEEAPLSAAIVGLADAWDAMTTDRPYHRALAPEEALRELQENRGTQFAPMVVDAFIRRYREQLSEQPGETAAPRAAAVSV
ncbi:MAG: HD-GYP domain-containing protein [Actinomycetota bacterium]|nr:HD-GYP domain-containing protein [Actinomycetota bacterium]